MSRMIKKELVAGIPSLTIDKDTCPSCILGKQARHSFPQETTYRAAQVLDSIHSDLCGPITPHTPSGKRYIFVLIDDYSCYMWKVLLSEKGEAFENLKKIKVYF